MGKGRCGAQPPDENLSPTGLRGRGVRTGRPCFTTKSFSVAPSALSIPSPRAQRPLTASMPPTSASAGRQPVATRSTTRTARSTSTAPLASEKVLSRHHCCCVVVTRVGWQIWLSHVQTSFRFFLLSSKAPASLLGFDCVTYCCAAQGVLPALPIMLSDQRSRGDEG